jgi:phosphohistidine swiveling domain-containing protein
MFPRFADDAAAPRLTTGMGASPGAAVGKVVFDSPTAVEWAARGEAVILVRSETNPDDLPAMMAAKGVLTRRGGKTSHAAVVARGLGKTCVVAAQELTLDLKGRRFVAPDGTVVAEGDVISIDGKSGALYQRAVAVGASPLVELFEGTFDATKVDAETRDLVASVTRILRHADARRLSVRANADTAPDARRARAYGAEGIGLCRTEHMFLGERRRLVERLILAETEREQQAALDALLPLQQADFVEAGPRHRRGSGAVPQGRRQPGRRGHGAGRRGGPRARARAGGSGGRDRGRLARSRGPPGKGHRHDDRAPEGLSDSSPDRRFGRLFLLRYQRPDPDHVGLSRDDCEASFSRSYMDLGIFGVSPFETLDTAGVGALVRMASAAARTVNPETEIGYAASTEATPTASTSSTRPASTTCRARRSGSRWHAWRRVRPPCRRRSPEK